MTNRRSNHHRIRIIAVTGTFVLGGVLSATGSVFAAGTCAGSKSEMDLNVGTWSQELWAYDKNGDGIICSWSPPHPTRPKPSSYGDNKI
jgi:hypothetical protein